MGCRSKLPGTHPHSLVTLDLLAHVLAGRARREILIALVRRPRCVSELAAFLGIEVSQISKDLGILHSAGAVVFVPDGHRRIYRPGPNLRTRLYRNTLVLHMRASCGSRIALDLSADFLAETERSLIQASATEISVVDDMRSARRG